MVVNESFWSKKSKQAACWTFSASLPHLLSTVSQSKTFKGASDQFGFVAVLLPGDGNARGLHLPVWPAPEAAYTSQQLADIHLLRPKEEQKLPRVKGQCCFQARLEAKQPTALSFSELSNVLPL